MIAYSDYHGPAGAHAAVNGKFVPLKVAAPILAENAMKLSVGAARASSASERERREAPAPNSATPNSSAPKK